jgi:16S rRNA (guanine527-N7)-methyltransferase
MTLLKPPSDPREILVLGSGLLGISLSNEAVERMLLHMRLLREWNFRVDLTSLTDPCDMAVLHFLDSLTLFNVIPDLCRTCILDIGTGGGFPGLVLRSVADSLQLILLDRNPAKIVFLKVAAKEMGLTGIRFLNSAVGSLLQEPAQVLCDVVVSRAFSSDAPFMDKFHVLLRPGGLLARMTGPSSRDESFSLEHFEVADMWEGILPFSTRFRRVVLYKKASV